jgi:hypothetical protein
MEPEFAQSTSRRCRRCAALVLLLILLFQSTAAASGGSNSHPRAPATQHRPAATVLVADGWGVGRAFGKVESFLSERRRMVQLATVGMLIGLFILLRK